jgi:hypothetical protein
MNRQAEPLRNPVQDKFRIVIGQDDPSDIAFISYLSGEGDQVTHAAAPSGHGYSAAEDPWILSERHPSLREVWSGHGHPLLARKSSPDGADIDVVPEHRNKMTSAAGFFILGRFADEPV